MMGHLAFGSKVGKFATMQNALMMCFQMVIGNYDYKEIQRTDEFLALLFFVPFMLIFLLVLMNIFLAIIDKSFRDQEAKFQERRKRRGYKPSKGGIVKRIRLFFRKFMPHGKGRTMSEDTQEETKRGATADLTGA